MKKSLLMLAAFLSCTMIMTVQTSCTNEDVPIPEDNSDATIVIDLDSIVIKPYLQFSSSLADVERYMADNFSDYTIENPDSLWSYEEEEGTFWIKRFVYQNRRIEFYFGDAEGQTLKFVTYDYFFPMPISAVMAELERNGFVNKGEVRFDDYNADICYLFLSADGEIESLVSSWEKDGGSWNITFQLTDPFDLEHLVK